MMVVAKNAEREFLSQIDHYVVHNSAMRCLLVRLSAMDLDYEEWFPRFAYELSRFFDDKTLAVYVCRDRDVFITARTVTQKNFEQFLTHLTPKLQPALRAELATLFEVGVHTGRIKSVCQAKLDAMRVQNDVSAKKAPEDLTLVSCDDMFREIDQDLIKSLSARRETRSDIQIMAVEDDAFSQKLIQSSLKNYSLHISEDGQGAVMNYVSRAPDVLFLDIGLPDIDGLTVLEKIFKIDPHAYVVMFSGNGSKDNIMRALEIGAKGFVGKPFTKDKLINYIEKSPHIFKKRGK